MGKRNPATEPSRREPTISYDRTLRLEAPDGGITLAHLKALLAHAGAIRLSPDAEVRVRSYGAFGSHETIEVVEKPDL